jgi:hypothetical protein
MMFVPQRKHRPPQLVTGIALLFFVDAVRTSEETQASTAGYRIDSFTFLYVDAVRSSEETQASTAGYGIALLFYM